jgi:hypothetical protein
MNPHKSPMIVFLLGFIPGLSHLYLNKAWKGLLYGGSFFGTVLLFFFVVLEIHDHKFALMLFVLGLLIWFVNMIDTAYTLLYRRPYNPSVYDNSAYGPANDGYPPHSSAAGGAPTGWQGNEASDRSAIMLLSLIPGLGHFRLGLMQRGLGFIISFVGLALMVFFVAMLTRRDEFLVFMGILPVIWIYNLFDCSQQLSRKERGEPLVDRTVCEDFQESRSLEHKNKPIASMLAMFPGTGHMYLGLQKRGLQLMALFLFSIFIMDQMRLSLFLFLIPILWFYSFFDALKYIAKYGREPLADEPVVHWLTNQQRWVGYGLLVLGAYYLFDQLLLDILNDWFPKHKIIYRFDRYFQPFVLSVLLIGSGLRLISGSFGKRRRFDDKHAPGRTDRPNGR